MYQTFNQGHYCKTFRNGQPVTNVRGAIAAPEQLLLLTKSGQARAGELDERVTRFQVRRPSITKAYATEKESSFIDRLIQQATLPDDWLLDPFAGSGVVGERCLRLQRFAVLVERAQQTVRDFILPRLAAAVAPLYAQPGHQLAMF